MIDPRNKLKLFYKDGANPVEEFSRDVADFGRDEYSLTFKAGDTIYIGYEKPINAFYVELTTASTQSGTITLQQNTTDGLEDVNFFHDDTRNFQRSGFIQWERIRSENQAVE